MTAWVDRMRGANVPAIAVALGRKVLPARGASGGSILGCPICNAERRHPSRADRRGALGVRRDGLGFRCHECDVSGDALDLVALVLRGKRLRDLGEAGVAEVREWCIRYTGSESNPFAVPPCRTADVEPPAPRYPPSEEIAALIEQCRRVDMDAGVSAYLRGRCIDPVRVADADLALALPIDAEPPAWAATWNEAQRRSSSWIDTSHRLIVPLFDAGGIMRSVLARCIDSGHKQKSLAPTGFARSGIVMACPFARWLLATGARPEWWPADQELRIVVAEGEPDFATIATTWSAASEFAPATLGVVAGAWSAAIATRVPDHTTVDVATHDDAAGDRYAAQIAESLAGRPIKVRRWKACQEPNA